MSTELAARSQRAWFACAIFATSLSLALARLLRYGLAGYAGTFADDFFYYAEIARNVAAGSGSTFDGITSTNGYQPLWLLILALLTFLVGPGPQVLIAVSVLVALASAGCFLASERLAAQRLGRSGALSISIATCTALLFSKLASQGMELVLVVPLLFMLLARSSSHDPGRPYSRTYEMRSGFVSALVVLSRLDSLLLVAPYAICRWLTASRSEIPVAARAAHWSFGFCPVGIYLLLNIGLFRRALPVSAEAKQLKPWSLSWTAPHFPLNALEHWFVVDAVVVAILIATTLLVCDRQWRERHELMVPSLAALAFPFVFYGVHGVLSDWPLWTWHLVPLVVAIPIAIPICLRSSARWSSAVRSALRWSFPATRGVLVALVAGPVLAALASASSPRRDHSLLKLGQRVADFARTHPGTYAMGDRAGIVAYLVDQPLIQLEGLVGDERMLSHLRSEDDLVRVLQDNDVDYYITTRPTRTDGCFSAVEPTLAGPSSPRMRGTFCGAPLLEDRAVDDGVVSLLFAVPNDD
jgi:hypothetical protein